MICRLCLNTLDEQNAVLLFSAIENEKTMPMPENYLVQLISTHLYLCLSRDDAISTSICSECCVQLESFHNFWKLVELKQTTLCSQFLEIDCDVNWSEEGDAELTAAMKEEPEADEAPVPVPPTNYDEMMLAVKAEDTELHESFLKADAKTTPHKFPCMFCEKSFKMRRYLEEHIATHTGDRPIACSYCEMAFRCRSNMYTHVKTKHTAQWLKARADRDAAKFNSNNNIQSQANGGEKALPIYMETELAKPATPPPQGQGQVQPPALVPSPAAAAAAAAPQLQEWNNALAPSEPELPPPPPPPPLPVSTSESSESKAEPINLTVDKSIASTRVTRSSRRKTHSPKKVPHAVAAAAEVSGSASDDSDAEDELDEKRRKATSKENELMLANYNAALVAASSSSSSSSGGLQQRLCASIMQQQELLTAMAATSATAVASSPATATATTSLAQLSPASTADAFGCSICGLGLRNQRALNNHLHNKHNALQPTPNLELAACASCGELPGLNHRCLSKAKYACDVCGKCFKMKRYLEEHFATHTGVKLHTCAFCPTQFRSKSNMYHHTKRKHKLEWEHSRATRNAAKTGTGTGTNIQEQLQLQQPLAAEEPAATHT